MKILIIMNYRSSTGGITGQIDELVYNLKNEGFDVKIISTSGSLFQRLLGISRALFAIPFYNKIIGVGSAFRGFIPIMVASMGSAIFGKSVIFNFHDGQAPIFLEKRRNLIKFILGKKPVIVATDFIARCFSDYGLNAVTIPYHFNLNRNIFLKNKKPEKNKIIWARSFYKLYQPELALKAATNALANNPALEFHFFGDGPLKNYFEKKYKHKNIIFRGRLKREKFLKELDDFSILINTTFYDNFPLSIVEAGWHNMLVISTKIGGIASIYNDNQVLYFETADELADLIIRACHENSTFDRIRNNLNKKVKTFTWLKVRNEWINLLNSKPVK